MFEIGAVYNYAYLWARQRDAGEISGRKNRPAALLLRNSRLPDLLFMFAISSSPPDSGRLALRLSPSECDRAGLRSPAWIYLDEFNVSSAADPVDFAGVAPLGNLSRSFVDRVRRAALENIRARRAIVVARS